MISRKVINLLKKTQPFDEKFGGRWKDDYSRKYMYALADDDTYAILSNSYEPLAVGIADYEYSEDDNEKCHMVKILATGKIHFTDGLHESYRMARQNV